MNSVLIDELLGLLEKERQAALAVDLDGLADIAKQKELQIAQLDISILNSKNFQQVEMQVCRNQAIFAAMIKGVESARSYMKRSSAFSGEANIYNKSGSTQLVGTHQIRNSQRF